MSGSVKPSVHKYNPRQVPLDPSWAPNILILNYKRYFILTSGLFA